MIGVFGGTFDPVHYGHLRPALALKEALGMDEVRMVPCQVPVHRDQPCASVEQRLAMLQAATEGFEGLLVDERELRRDTPSYMVETLQSLRDELGEQEPLVLMLGMDAFLAFASWRQPERILELAHIVVANRPGSHWQADKPLQSLVEGRMTDDPQKLGVSAAGLVCILEVPEQAVSSTEIRERVRNGRPIEDMLPAVVQAMIEEQHLYC